MSFSPEEFGSSYKRFLEWVTAQAPTATAPLRALLEEHFGADPRSFPVTTQDVPPYDLPNLQVAVEAYLEGRPFELVGFAAPDFAAPSLAMLVNPRGNPYAIEPGPVDRTVVRLDGDRTLSCVRTGLYLLRDGDDRLALLVARERQTGYHAGALSLEVMSPEASAGERLLADLGQLMHERNVYRGKVVSLAQQTGGMPGQAMAVTFHDRPGVAREDIVLPEGVLERVERSTITFAREAGRLLASGRHLRRGLLLHGPPGTGKTLTTKYLTRALEGRTVLLLTGSGLGLIEPSCAMARQLQPSMVVLEDVDLVAQERTLMGVGATALLFQLLNEMDGFGDDADVIFLLTTNRADLLEPALAARPGRIDLAIELPLPDAPSRQRLLELFQRGLETEVREPQAIVEQTDGASPAFLRELVRKAALLAAEENGRALADRHFEAALDELAGGGRLTRRILGAESGGEGGPPPGWPPAGGYP